LKTSQRLRVPLRGTQPRVSRVRTVSLRYFHDRRRFAIWPAQSPPFRPPADFGEWLEWQRRCTPVLYPLLFKINLKKSAFKYGGYLYQ
jgi:hypothetical protein